MSCYFCGGSRIASIHSAPDRGVCNWSVGSMTLARRYDGEPIVRVELDTSVMLDISVNDSCGDTVSADVTADAYIEDIKYCPFCGEEASIRSAVAHGRADAPRVTSARIGETERRARALERDRARALKRSRKAKR